MQPAAAPAAPGRWANRGLWAVLDQGLFAVANFTVGVILARHLAPEVFGAFTVAYTVFLLIGAFHISFLIEPMLVFGPGKYAGGFREYLRLLLRGHWIISSAGGALLALSALYLWGSGATPLVVALGSAAAATPILLLVWLVRRACFVRLRPDWAAQSGALYLGVMVLGLALLAGSGALSVPAAFAVLAVASLAASLWTLAGLRRESGAEAPPELAEVRRDHWRYGRWALATGILSWVSLHVYYVLLPGRLGLEASAALRALMYLVLPMLHVNTGLAALLVPALVQARSRGGLRRVFLVAFTTYGLFSLAYWAVLSLGSEPLVSFLYGGRYVEYAGMLWYLGTLPFLAGIAVVMGSTLRALQRPDLVFWAEVGAAAVALTVGLAAMVRWGVPGAVAGQILSYVAMIGVFVAAFLRRSGPVRAGGAPPAAAAAWVPPWPAADRERALPAPVRVSVVVPVYNAASYVRRTLQSIARQTYPHFEVLVVDDGSTDGSAAEVERFCALDPRFRLYRQRHAGVVAGRTLAIEKARGEWIALCDADDMWDHDKLRRQVEFLQRYRDASGEPVVAVGTCGYHINAGDRIVGRYDPGMHTPEEFRAIRRAGEVVYMLNSSVVFRRDVFFRAGGYRQDYVPAEDVDLWTRMAPYGLVLNLPDRLAYYRIHGQSASDRTYLRQMVNVSRVRENLRRRTEGVPELAYPEYLEAMQRDRTAFARRRRAWMSHMLYRKGASRIANGSWLGGIPFLARSVLHQPGLAFRRLRAQLGSADVIRRIAFGETASAPRTRRGTVPLRRAPAAGEERAPAREEGWTDVWTASV